MTSDSAVSARGVVIRRAGSPDGDAVIQLLQQLWPNQAGVTGLAPAAFDRGLRNPDRIYLCATLDGAVVGFGSLSWESNLWQASFLGATIDELVVHERCRGQGIGDALLTALVDEARARGFRVVELTSAAHRLDAHRFYEKRGFTLRNPKLFHKVMTPDAPARPS
jgi:ribosomal protein S18 acetylase RimI-like enzyme